MRHINTQELREKKERNQDFLLLNALPEESFRKEHIPGSENVPYDDDNLVEKVENLAGSKEKEIVVYCANEECSASTKAVEKLDKAGFTNVVEYDGGTESWKEADYKIEQKAA